jgi:hypothetical protein
MLRAGFHHLVELAAMRDTWDFERPSMPRVLTSPSTRRVDTPRT